MDKKTVTLTMTEWRVVTAALLCLHDYDDSRGYEKGVAETNRVRDAVRSQLGR